jgi:fructose-1,6-bisphosphatase/inositol monophosphatase family enzyme
MRLSKLDIEHLAQVGLDAALSSGEYIASQIGQVHDTTFKSGVQSLATQVVTAVDVKSQEIILEKLAESIIKYDLGLLSEEMPDDQSRFEKEYFWSIDPLDGTLPFTEQRQGYAVSIALLNKLGAPIIGIVVDPYLKKHFVAIKGAGCFVNGKPYQVDPDKRDQLICHFDRSFVSSVDYDSTVSQLHQIREKLGLSDLKIKTGAGAVMNALGLLDSAYGCYVKLPKPTKGGGCLWDFSATSLIFEELGLHISDSFGQPLALNRTDSFYMNKEGVLFASNITLGKELILLAEIVERTFKR